MQGRNPAADKQKAKATAAKDWSVRELLKDYRAKNLVSLAESTQTSYGPHLKRAEKKLGALTVREIDLPILALLRPLSRIRSTAEALDAADPSSGEKLFADFAGDTVAIIDVETGEIRRAHIFVAVLGASNYTYVGATAAETQADWLGSLGRALCFIGGVTELIVPDNSRALIGEANRYNPMPQRMAADFAAHYGTVILPARPYRPQDKVEVGVLIVQRWILAHLRCRRFFSLTELNTAIGELVEDISRRPFPAFG